MTRRWPGSSLRLAASLAVAGLLAACEVTDPDRLPPPCEVALAPSPVPALRVGDTLRLSVQSDARCAAAIVWSSDAPQVAAVDAGLVRAVAAGQARVTANAFGVTTSVAVPVVARFGAASFRVRGQGTAPSGRITTDVWVRGDLALTTTSSAFGGICGGAGRPPCPDAVVHVWNVADPSRPLLVDSVPVPAIHVNDVKISADGRFAVVTLEAGTPGIAILDLANPLRPRLVTQYGVGLEGGVHNVWIERLAGTDFLFVVEDGESALGGLHVLDVTSLASPREVAHYWAGSSFLHDVVVRDGLAFLSHWDAGLVILDVGNGMRGGSPTRPVEVSRFVTEGGDVHNAWYWPAARYVFIGEEDFQEPREPPGSVGRIHVLDVTDLTAPVEVASFGGIPESPHDFWMDEDRGILFDAWYGQGLVAIDVRGRLSGRLEEQGRRVAVGLPAGGRAAPNFWAVQIHRGLLWLSDQENGLWALELVLGG
jgi:hypothetical protein